MTDNVCVWRIRDSRCKHETGDIIAKDKTPAAYEYLIACNGQTFDTKKYPQLAKLYTNGRLPNLNDNRFLEGSATAGTSKDAGLPQHTHSGTTNSAGSHRHGISQNTDISNGGAQKTNEGYHDTINNYDGQGTTTWTSYSGDHTHTFTTGNASNDLYGKSDTVQPKSYTVTYYVCYA